MPAGIPSVQEVGATSAPLTSAAYFIGDRCKAFNDDFMKCKAESNGRGEFDCLKEGRKVTRCAASVYVLFPSIPYPSGVVGEISGVEGCANSVQYQRYQHPLSETVHCALGVS
jgi:hypothetical protein